MNTVKNPSAEKIYLVSFGNSDKYVLRDTEIGEKSELTKIEAELNAFLRSKFPDDTFAYFTTPRVDEISSSHSEEYASYPALDGVAIESIKKVLAREVEDLEANRRINDNAPFANVNPAAAGMHSVLG